MSLSKPGRERLDKQVSFLRERGEAIVLDADTHITDPRALPPEIEGRIKESGNYFHGKPLSAEQLLAYLDHAEVDGCLSWQNPACTVYPGNETDNYKSLLEANRYIYDAAVAYPERIFPAGWTDPRALGVTAACDLAEQLIVEFGFPIVKMNPAQNQFPIDSDYVLRVMERINKFGGAVAFHYGADTDYTPASGLERAAQAFPGMTVIGVHMGGGGASYLASEELYRESRALGLRQKNIHFIFSAKRDTHIESDLIEYQLAGASARKRLSCASDAPYGLPTWNFGGFRTLFASLRDGANHPDERLRGDPELFDDESIAGYLGGNLAKLMVRIGERVLRTEARV